MEILQNWETVTIFLKLWGGSFLQVEGVMFIVILVLVCILVPVLDLEYIHMVLYKYHHGTGTHQVPMPSTTRVLIESVRNVIPRVGSHTRFHSCIHM